MMVEKYSKAKSNVIINYDRNKCILHALQTLTTLNKSTFLSALYTFFVLLHKKIKGIKQSQEVVDWHSNIMFQRNCSKSGCTMRASVQFILVVPQKWKRILFCTRSIHSTPNQLQSSMKKTIVACRVHLATKVVARARLWQWQQQRPDHSCSRGRSRTNKGTKMNVQCSTAQRQR